MLIGYARVSTNEQNLNLQKDALEKVGCEKIFVDEISGSVMTRPGLEKALDMLREKMFWLFGDLIALVVLSRISSN